MRPPAGDGAPSCPASLSSRRPRPRRDRARAAEAASRRLARAGGLSRPVEGARRATSADVECLNQLVARAGIELQALRGGPALARGWSPAAPGRRPWEPRFEDPASAVLVGTLGPVVVGYAVVSVDTRAGGAPCGVVEELYVEPPARSVGVGEALMDMAVTWCRERDCQSMDVPVLPGHREAKNFLEMSGFSARLIVMHRVLGD